MLKVNIAKDFNRFPSGRYKRLGTTSGEGFRELFLETPLKQGKSITVELDGTIGYGSSFLDEAFGGLVRVLKISPHELKSKIHLVSEDPALIEEVLDYIDNAERGQS